MDITEYYWEDDRRNRALQAWNKVINAIRHIGSYETVIFDDPIIHAVISRMGSWIELCQKDDNALTFYAEIFIEYYLDHLVRPPSYYPKCLIGRFEQDNRQHGYSYCPVVFLGNLALAQRVFVEGGDNCHKIQRHDAFYFVKNKSFSKKQREL